MFGSDGLRAYGKALFSETSCMRYPEHAGGRLGAYVAFVVGMSQI